MTVADNSKSDSTTRDVVAARASAQNLAEPIRLKKVELAGVAAHSVRPGETVEVWQQLATTSDDLLFHKSVANLANFIDHVAQEAGTLVRVSRANDVLLVIRHDDSGELWVNTVALSVQATLKKSVAAGAPIFESDVADVIGLSFPAVSLGPKDRLLYLFREGWRFALYFDLRRDRDLDLIETQRALGTLYRELKFRNLYDVLDNEALLSKLFSLGWFPFAEIIGREFQDLASHVEAGFDIVDAEATLLTRFDDARIDRILDRWLLKPHYSAKEALLRSAVKAFKSGDPVPVIKIILTEIEGILAEAYFVVHGTKAKIKTLLQFAIESAEKKTGSPNTLLLPRAFAQYLLVSTFANFDPTTSTGTASSRHAVGHGAASAASYTSARSLQALLILDQLAFYT